MTYDIEVRSFPVVTEDDLKAQLAKCTAEGLVPMPGVPPVITYWLVRVTAQQTAGFGTMQVDDSKVQIIRAGEKPKPN